LILLAKESSSKISTLYLIELGEIVDAAANDKKNCEIPEIRQLRGVKMMIIPELE
jgi:hypothetical protein